MQSDSKSRAALWHQTYFKAGDTDAAEPSPISAIFTTEGARRVRASRADALEDAATFREKPTRGTQVAATTSRIDFLQNPLSERLRADDGGGDEAIAASLRNDPSLARRPDFCNMLPLDYLVRRKARVSRFLLRRVIAAHPPAASRGSLVHFGLPLHALLEFQHDQLEAAVLDSLLEVGSRRRRGESETALRSCAAMPCVVCRVEASVTRG